jgi:hypothetical protein
MIVSPTYIDLNPGSVTLDFVTLFFLELESISPTFKKRICANILAPIKSLTFPVSTKKLRTKLSYEKAARKMLVKLTP